MTGRTLGAALLVVATAVSVAGCGSKPEFAETPVPPDAGPPPPPATTSAPPPAPPPPTSTQCDAVQTLAMTTAFQGRAGTEAPKMQPEGTQVCSVVPEGQTAAGQTFVLQPGNCYTVLAQALPTVSEVDVQLELDLAGGAGLPPALAALNIKPMLAVDPDSGPTAAIGAKQACYQWPFPIPAAVRVVVKARTGSGPIAAQVYSRKK
ncbi:MAG: hypothetical protein IT372_03915 [Polyangiaceae bacterium]|nr:hypothetical protein [Polyangiaceae bacterium]